MNSVDIWFNAIAILVLLRIIHRLYYVLRKHQHRWRYDCRQELANLLSQNRVKADTVTFKSPKSNVDITYQKIGSGSKVIYLANGVGTGLFMWGPVFCGLLQLNPKFFDLVTILAPNYRGLFSYDEKYGGEEKNPPVDVTMENCVLDAKEVIKHAGGIYIFLIVTDLNYLDDNFSVTTYRL